MSQLKKLRECKTLILLWVLKILSMHNEYTKETYDLVEKYIFFLFIIIIREIFKHTYVLRSNIIRISVYQLNFLAFICLL